VVLLLSCGVVYVDPVPNCPVPLEFEYHTMLPPPDAVNVVELPKQTKEFPFTVGAANGLTVTVTGVAELTHEPFVDCI
jgi:hypothetical protein